MYDTTPAAEAIVSRVAHLLAPAEITRMRASLEIDLDRWTETSAIARALGTLHRTRSENGATPTVEREMDVIAALIYTDAEPIAAPRDWNDEAARIVATYASDVAPGYALNVEPVDHADYRPYSRVGTSHIGGERLAFRTRVESPVL